MADAIFKVEGVLSPDCRLAVENALRKYSGVLGVNFGHSGSEPRVRYEPGNILAGDLKETIEREGYPVISVRE